MALSLKTRIGERILQFSLVACSQKNSDAVTKISDEMNKMSIRLKSHANPENQEFNNIADAIETHTDNSFLGVMRFFNQGERSDWFETGGEHGILKHEACPHRYQLYLSSGHVLAAHDSLSPVMKGIVSSSLRLHAVALLYYIQHQANEKSPEQPRNDY